MLAIAAAGLSTSVAVAKGERVLATGDHAQPHGQAEALLPLIDRTMREAGLPPAAIETIAVEIGPGSFTGIRVGLAASRGIALATGARLVGLTGFEMAAAGVPAESAPLLVALESRRDDLFVQLFDADLAPSGEPASVSPQTLGQWLQGRPAPLALAGNAAARAAAALDPRRVPALPVSVEPEAVLLLRAAWRRRRQRLAGRPAQPFYLRPPDVTPARPAGG